LPFRSPDKVYQHIIDNRDERGRVVDLRLVYVCGQSPVTYFKFKSDEARYSNETRDVALAETETCFTDDELHLVAELMTRLGVDVAELDILRDRSTQSIFVVDVNPTPWGPPAGLNPKDAAQAIETIATAFRQAIEANQPSK
jgi:glutathione synthase/RimK-type ligase-like ATP-grasp enzyme